MIFKILFYTIKNWLKYPKLKFGTFLNHFNYIFLFNSIVNTVPNNSFFYVYELHTEEFNYYNILNKYISQEENKVKDEFMENPEIVIKLDQIAKKEIINLWENTSMHSDLIHFCIYFQKDLLVSSYDALQNTVVKKEIIHKSKDLKYFYSKKLISVI